MPSTAPKDGARATRLSSRHALVVFLAISLLTAACGSKKAPAPPGLTASNPPAESTVPEVEEYRILVQDELDITVVGHPEVSGLTRVLPDGTISVAGVGSIYVLGSTVSEAAEAVNRAIGRLVRYPSATIRVANFGSRRVYVMGEVPRPGEFEFHRGMTALSAVAQAGGFSNTAKRSSVMILRRLGADQAVAFQVDLRDPLKGEGLGKDPFIRPFDIVFVPKTFIASVGVLVDQYFRQMTPPFTFYIEGWQAFHLDEERVSIVTQ